eukprot:gnl/TRDRNA2_/TRDRNA2_80518_c0_seq2.p1 gnl/TRDRNA2_/TRDRNA2_80518_c0~~gnl/TRDRNA2_/TRDRNA2_80518_c0_seq2.p1  ORF type:complete len:318 (+),score=67.81 gnl/TRDRNA2_/TRDRNA2_80518_c0_seq2:54-1007(+)
MSRDAEAAAEEVAKAASISSKYELTGEVVYTSVACTILHANQKASGVEVVIKVVFVAKCDDKEEVRRAQAEVEAHRNLPPHPNIVSFLDAEETTTAILLVIEYTAHGDLWSLVRYGQTYCEQEVRNCAAQLLAALEHVHTHCKLVHLDIKPHNLLLFLIDGRLVLQLCDFGLAEQLLEPRRKVRFNGVRGTSGWIAPEVLRREDYGEEVDLFGSGIILFRMLGGYHPFDPPSNFKEGAQFDDSYWCHISPLCRDFLAKMLAIDPAERGTASELRAHAWLEGPPPPEPSPEILERLSNYGPPPTTDVLFWPVKEVPVR